MSDTLIKVAKDGAVLSVHPSCVDAHAAVGWVLVPDVPKPEAPAGPDLNGMTAAELKAFAADNQIDLGEAAKKADMIEKIEAALVAPVEAADTADFAGQA